MNDLIRREALIEKLEEYIEYDTFDLYKEEPLISIGFEQLEDIICSQPTVEAKEVVHGEWIRTRFASEYICSNCQALTYAELTRTGYKNYNFCPQCGCDMRTSAE